MNTEIYRHGDGCQVEEMDNEALLYNPRGSNTLHLNQSSLVVWQLLDGQRSVTQIIELLESEFPDQASQIKQDVEAVMAEFINQKVVEIA